MNEYVNNIARHCLAANFSQPAKPSKGWGGAGDQSRDTVRPRSAVWRALGFRLAHNAKRKGSYGEQNFIRNFDRILPVPRSEPHRGPRSYPSRLPSPAPPHPFDGPRPLRQSPQTIPQQPVHTHFIIYFFQNQIGRASCRERV